jgi:hypothetical protein
MQWAVAHPQGRGGGSPDGSGRVDGALGGGVRGGHAPDGGGSPDRPVAELTEIAAFTGGAALPSRTGTLVTAGSRPLLGTSVPALGGLPSPRPSTSNGSR